MQQLTTKQQIQLDGWVEEVLVHESSMMKCAEALTKIKKSGFWKATHTSWLSFCEEKFTFTRRQAYDWIRLFKHTEALRLIAETTGEAEVPRSLKQAERQITRQACDVHTSEHKIKHNLSTMSAKHDTTGPEIQVLKPKPPPLDLKTAILSAIRHLDKLLHRHDLPYEAILDLKGACADCERAFQVIQQHLPGLEPTDSQPKFRRPSLEEIQLHCEKSGICGSDADWFWNHMEGNGWKINGKQIASWPHVLAAWKAQKYLPSLKLPPINGKPAETIGDVVWRDTLRAARKGL